MIGYLKGSCNPCPMLGSHPLKSCPFIESHKLEGAFGGCVVLRAGPVFRQVTLPGTQKYLQGQRLLNLYRPLFQCLTILMRTFFPVISLEFLMFQLEVCLLFYHYTPPKKSGSAFFISPVRWLRQQYPSPMVSFLLLRMSKPSSQCLLGCHVLQSPNHYGGLSWTQSSMSKSFGIKEPKTGRRSRPSVTITVQPQDGGSTCEDAMEILGHTLQ